MTRTYHLIPARNSVGKGARWHTAWETYAPVLRSLEWWSGLALTALAIGSWAFLLAVLGE